MEIKYILNDEEAISAFERAKPVEQKEERNVEENRRIKTEER